MDATLERVQAQAQVRQLVDDAGPEFPQRVLVVMENQEIIAIPHILPESQFIHDMVVQAIQHHIGKELRSQVADGQAQAPLDGAVQVVSGEPCHDWFLRVAPIDHQVKHPQETLVGDHASDALLDDLVIQTGEELGDITLEDEPPPLR
jgi:hypothetical protein